MKPAPILLLAAGIFLLGGAVSADFDLKKWPLWREVRIEPKPAESAYVQIELDGPVFAGTRRDLADLRVIDQSGAEAPSQVVTAEQRDLLNVKSVEMLDKGLAPDGRFSFTADLGDEPIRHNRVILSTTAVNFSRRVRIETSDDNKNWAVARDDGYIFSFQPDSPVKYLGVDYPISTRRYLRVTVFNLLSRKEDPIEITNAEVAINAVPDPQLVELPVASIKRSEDSGERATVYNLDLGYQNVPSTAIEIETSQTNFQRYVEITGKQKIEDDPKLEPLTWSPVGNGNVYRVAINGHQADNLKVDYLEAGLRYLRIRVYHYDDRPIKIDRIRVLALPRKLVFRADPGSTYRLFYGNPQATSPRYDLQRMIRYIDLSRAMTATLGPQQGETAKSASRSEEEKPGQPVWLIAVLIASTLILLWLIIKLAKKTAV